ncbi:hypothetical protein BO85DRAFT_460024 [Aspergillus piperis CBS 112811]|uniref:LysM domain-containing protein n=1 Tax=Aspergillus piperis CBS 112811 TaxID=1448313 RepID=A0A8G1VKC8_9EURO|nr:hypothetical protein BO85DRAFT_460024 [Aspergillus piperis CBS 112811]RAH56629.1 hypothetical protein BO85DRAFT_460024 [Aspergillus piperis CBS 112811]
MLSILAWLKGSTNTTGQRVFEGFIIYDSNMLPSIFSDACITALTTTIKCDLQANYNRAVLLDHPAIILGGNMWEEWNETCYKDPTTGKYCNDVISQFTHVTSVDLMPKDKIPYSYYNQRYKYNLETVIKNCDKLFFPDDSSYITKDGDTCTSIALDYSIRDCNQVVVGQELCLPLSCDHTYVLKSNDTCRSIEEANAEIVFDNSTKRIIPLRQVNPWIDTYCSNLQSTSWAYGKVLCLTPQSGLFNATDPVSTSYNPWGTESSGYGSWVVLPPDNATVAAETTKHCGKWHTATTEDSCTQICVQDRITSNLFLQVNPSLQSANCTGLLIPGNAYCTGPMRGWNYTVAT